MNKKNKIISYIATGVLIVLLATATYAYFQNQVGNTTIANINIETATVDSLAFRVSDIPTLEVSQDIFNRTNMENASVTGWAEAFLLGNTTDNYYVYLDIEENEIEYLNGEEPELLLSVTYQENNGTATNVTLTGLGNATTQNGVTGYDITGYVGLVPIAINKAITGTGEQTERYNITVTLINHDRNQNGNANKNFESKIIIGHEAYSASYSFTQGANSTWDGESDLTLAVNQNLSKFRSLEIDDTTVNSSNYTLASGSTILTLSSTYLSTLSSGEHEVVFNYTDGIATTTLTIENTSFADYIIELSSTNEHIYHHDSSLTNGAKDDSYRYAGPNSTVDDNYVCFGYNRESYNNECESGTFSATSVYAYRIIGVFKDVDGNSNDAYYVKLIKATSYGSYHWDKQSSTGSNSSNGFTSSQLFSTTLNGANSSYLATLKSNGWSNYLAQPKWYVGGNTYTNIQRKQASIAYTNERTSTNAVNTTYKIGLMYPSDYGFATSNSYWTTQLESYNSAAKDYNWLYLGSTEWTISRCTDNTDRAFDVESKGNVYNYGVYTSYVVRPVLYLSSSTKLDGNRLGTINSPYMLSL